MLLSGCLFLLFKAEVNSSGRAAGSGCTVEDPICFGEHLLLLVSCLITGCCLLTLLVLLHVVICLLSCMLSSAANEEVPVAAVSDLTFTGNNQNGTHQPAGR